MSALPLPLPLILSALLACTPETEVAPPRPPVPLVGSYLLARHPEDLVSVSLPPRSRPTAPTERILVSWVPMEDGFAAPNPTTVDLSGGVPLEFSVVDLEGEPLPQSEDGAPGTWRWDGQRLRLTPRPGTLAEDYAVQDSEALAQLRRLGRADADVESDAAFLFRSERRKNAWRHGVFLPAPAEATWSLTVPARAKLLSDAMILPSPLRGDPESNGATLVVEVIAGEPEAAAQEVARVQVAPGRWEDVQADLSPWAGQTVQLRLRSEPDGHSASDYLMVGDPMVYTPREDPRRIVVVVADTLRADHMGMYGYARETTPNLDHWAKQAAVFDARTVAPWTYPAMRSVLSGRLPDRWEGGATLPERLAAAGWNTLAISTNPYMRGSMGMAEGWGWHLYQSSADSRTLTRVVRDFLPKNADRDLLVLLHVMDVHLPYTEPEPYRSRWAGDSALADLPDPIKRSHLLKYPGDQEAMVRYLTDRYDQSLRYLDRSVAPLILDDLTDNDAVIFLSDHGEEFLDHGGLEHGHSLHEELLRVPLIVDAPGIDGARPEGRASLLDVTPTVLDIAGLPPAEGLAGRSLLPAARGEASLPDRPLGFGYILYGEDGWAALDADSEDKWWTRGGELGRYDLAADPGETRWLPAADPAPLRAALEAGLDRTVAHTWRLVLPEDPLQRPERLRFQAEGGFLGAWASLEAPEIPPITVNTVGEDLVEVVGGGGVLPREIFVAPRGADAVVTATVGEGGAAVVLEAGGRLDGGVEVGRAWSPQPAARLETTAASIQAQLEALGYIDER